MAKKIRILFLCADPRGVGYRPLLKREFREIDIKIKSSPNHDIFKIKSEWAVRPDDLQEALLKHCPHIVHLSTHANRAEGILLEDDFGEKKAISSLALAGFLSKLESRVCIVFLNACYTKRQMKPFVQTIDYTIAMNTSIGDKGAIVFAASFYRGLAFGLSVKAAFDLAITQLELESIPDTKTPVLLVREGIDASESFLAKYGPRAEASKGVRNRTKGANDQGSIYTGEASRGIAEPDSLKRTKKKHKKKRKKNVSTKDQGEIRKLLKAIRYNLKQLEKVLFKHKSLRK